MMHTNKALRDHKISFDIEAPVEPFYSEQNQKQLEKSAKQIADGDVVVKTIEELEKMETV